MEQNLPQEYKQKEKKIIQTDIFNSYTIKTSTQQCWHAFPCAIS